MSRNDEFAWLNIDNHRGPGTWLEEMRARGFAVPLALCRGVSQAMEALAVSFPEAFRVLWRNRAIVVVGRTVIYDLRRPAAGGCDSVQSHRTVFCCGPPLCQYE